MGQDLGRADDPLLARARRDMEAWHIDHVTAAYHKCSTLNAEQVRNRRAQSPSSDASTGSGPPLNNAPGIPPDQRLTRAQFFAVFGPAALDASVIKNGVFLSLPLWFFDLFSSEARVTVPPAPQLRKSATAIPGRRSMARSSRRGTVATASFRYADASSNALPKPSGLAPIIPDAVQVASPTSVGPTSPKRSVSPHSPQRSPKRGLSRSPSRRGGHASASAKHLHSRTLTADAAAPPPTVSARQIFTCLSLFCDGPLAARLRLCFSVFDADSNLVMDKDEMLAFLKEVSEVLVVMKMLPHMPHEAVLSSVADQAFFEADTDRSGQIDVDEFLAWARKSMSCALLCNRFENATKEILEYTNARAAAAKSRRDWFKVDSKVQHKAGWSTRFIHQPRGVVPPKQALLGDPAMAPGIDTEEAKDSPKRKSVAQRELKQQWGSVARERRTLMKYVKSGAPLSAFLGLLQRQRDKAEASETGRQIAEAMAHQWAAAAKERRHDKRDRQSSQHGGGKQGKRGARSVHVSDAKVKQAYGTRASRNSGSRRSSRLSAGLGSTMELLSILSSSAAHDRGDPAQDTQTSPRPEKAVEKPKGAVSAINTAMLDSVAAVHRREASIHQRAQRDADAAAGRDPLVRQVVEGLTRRTRRLLAHHARAVAAAMRASDSSDDDFVPPPPGTYTQQDIAAAIGGDSSDSDSGSAHGSQGSEHASRTKPASPTSPSADQLESRPGSPGIFALTAAPGATQPVVQSTPPAAERGAPTATPAVASQRSRRQRPSTAPPRRHQEKRKADGVAPAGAILQQPVVLQRVHRGAVGSAVQVIRQHRRASASHHGRAAVPHGGDDRYMALRRTPSESSAQPHAVPVPWFALPYPTPSREVPTERSTQRRASKAAVAALPVSSMGAFMFAAHQEPGLASECTALRTTIQRPHSAAPLTATSSERHAAVRTPVRAASAGPRRVASPVQRYSPGPLNARPTVHPVPSPDARLAHVSDDSKQHAGAHNAEVDGGLGVQSHAQPLLSREGQVGEPPAPPSPTDDEEPGPGRVTSLARMPTWRDSVTDVASQGVVPTSSRYSDNSPRHPRSGPTRKLSMCSSSYRSIATEDDADALTSPAHVVGYFGGPGNFGLTSPMAIRMRPMQRRTSVGEAPVPPAVPETLEDVDNASTGPDQEFDLPVQTPPGREPAQPGCDSALEHGSSTVGLTQQASSGGRAEGDPMRDPAAALSLGRDEPPAAVTTPPSHQRRTGRQGGRPKSAAPRRRGKRTARGKAAKRRKPQRSGPRPNPELRGMLEQLIHHGRQRAMHRPATAPSLLDAPSGVTASNSNVTPAAPPSADTAHGVEQEQSKPAVRRQHVSRLPRVSSTVIDFDRAVRLGRKGVRPRRR